MLSEPARASRTRGESSTSSKASSAKSVEPMEKIEGIKILHVDGIDWRCCRRLPGATSPTR